MSKFYESPELEIRRYNFLEVTYTTSTPETDHNDGDNDLTDGDDYDPFG